MPRKDYDCEKILSTGVHRYFVEQKFVDVKISWENSILIECHKIVLASFSTFFESLLENTVGCAILSVDAVCAVNVSHLRDIVTFMYGQQICIKRRHAGELSEAAKVFGVTALIKVLNMQISKPPNDGDEEILMLKPCGFGSLLLINFQRYKNASKFVDVEISCQNVTLFSCHKLMLASFSTYFESLLVNTEGCAILSLDAVDTLYVGQLKLLLNFMYGFNIGDVLVDDRDVDLLKDAANIFGINGFEMICVKRGKAWNATNKASSATKKLSENSNHVTTSGASVAAVFVNTDKTVAENTQDEIINEGNMAAAIVQQDDFQTLTPVITTDVTIEVPSSSAEQIPVASVDESPSCLEQEMHNSEIIIKPPPPITADQSSSSRSQSCEPCPFCGKSLTVGSRAYDAHMRKHLTSTDHDTTMFRNEYSSCKRCGELFSYGQKSKHQCPNQSKRSKLDDSLEDANILDVLSVKSSAGNCSIKTPEISNNSQESTVPIVNYGKLLCTVCRMELADEESLMEHFNTAHNVNVHSASSHVTQHQSCHMCHALFENRSILHQHLQHVHEITLYGCAFCSKSFKTEIGCKNHSDNYHKATTFKCDFCDFQTKAKTYLNVHMMNAHETTLNGRHKQKKFACSECGLTFVFECLLKRHFDTKHLKYKPFKCPHCNYCSSEKTSLNIHIRSVHLLVKPFLCSMCDHKCSTASQLARHRRIHTGEKPYACTQCDLAFPEKRDLTVHIAKEHDRVRPFACKFCLVKFFRKDFLLTHLRMIHGTAVMD